jgi:DNA-binding response OmpR family regulator
MDSGTKVLIVDDDLTICNLLHQELDEHACVCTEAQDGITALNNLASQYFDVVLLDVRLPGMSGVEVLKEIKSRYMSTATIMITAVNDIDTAVRAIKLGAFDYLVKPFDLDRLVASVENAVATELENSLASKYANEIDGIALGLEQRFDLVDGRNKFLTKATADVAQSLNIPEQEIRNWVENRLRLDLEKKKQVASALDKLEGSPLAQILFSLCPDYSRSGDLWEKQN